MPHHATIINSFGHRHTNTHTHSNNPHRINFKKPVAHRPQAGTPGLTTDLW